MFALVGGNAHIFPHNVPRAQSYCLYHVPNNKEITPASMLTMIRHGVYEYWRYFNVSRVPLASAIVPALL
jgi:hypothetical protein